MTDRPFPHEHVASQSDAPDAERLAALAALFPEAMSEGQVDVEKLREWLEARAAATTGPERYSFSWAGKRDAMRAAQTPSAATLIPEPGQSVDFETTQNLYIEADNLEALRLLRRAYFGRVKMIYIDPPYNTGNDFVYPDDYADPLSEYLELTGQRDASGNLLTTNTESSGRYHSAWLSMMYPRLALARSFLREDGVIFVSIDDHEVHNLRLLMNEIFGEENFVATLVWQKKYGPANDATQISQTHEYIVAYARDAAIWNPQLFARTDEQLAAYRNPDKDPRGPWRASDLSARTASASTMYPITTPSGKVVNPPASRSWIISSQRYAELVADNRIWFGVDGDGRPMQKKFLSEVKQGITPQTWWDRDFAGDNKIARYEIKDLFPENVFDTPKPAVLIRRLLDISTAENSHDIVLDFFSGSATTAQAVLELNREDGGNRRFILVQLPEQTPLDSTAWQAGFTTIAEIGKERIRRVIARMRAADVGTLPLSTREEPEDLGFRVFRLARSSVRSWQPPEGSEKRDADAWLRQMELTGSPIAADAAERDLIWEAAIREGYSLTARVEAVPDVVGPGVWRVSDPDRDQSFYVCLAERIELAPLGKLNLTRDDLFICRETALDDTTGANLALQCRLKTL